MKCIVSTATLKHEKTLNLAPNSLIFNIETMAGIIKKNMKTLKLSYNLIKSVKTWNFVYGLKLLVDILIEARIISQHM